MTSSKDVFEPRAFAGRAFAPGAFRGLGADVQAAKKVDWQALDSFTPGFVEGSSFTPGFVEGQSYRPAQ